MIDGIAEYKERRLNTQLCIKRLGEYIDSHGIHRGPCTIYGKDGPVYWESISDHPKIRSKFGENYVTQ